MKRAYIYLDQDAELAELIEVLRQQKGNDFVVVAPKEARLFSHPINIEILSREAKNLEKHLTFDVADSRARKILENNDFDILDKEKKEEAEDRTKIISDIHHPAHVRPASPEAQETIVNELQTGKVEKETARKATVLRAKEKAQDEFIEKFYKEKPEFTLEGDKERRKRPVVRHTAPLIIGLFTIILLIGVFLFTTFYLSRAKLILTSDKTDHVFEYKLTLDKRATTSDATKLVFPATEVKIEKALTQQYPASANENISVKARGTIVIYNKYSGAPQTLIATTRFKDEASGKIFRLLKKTIIPGNGSTSVEVEADQPGEAYNIAAERLVIPAFEGTPRFDKIYAIAQKPFSGGFKGWSKVVSNDDLSKARETIIGDTQKTLEAELKLKYGDLLFLDGLISKAASIDSYSPKVGEPGEQLTVSSSGVLTGLGFNDPALREFIRVLENKLLEADQEIKDVSVSKIEVKLQNFSKGQATLVVTGSSLFAKKIDVSKVKEAIGGKSLDDLKVVLNEFTNIAKVDASLWPFWLKKIPSNTAKIKILIQ